MFVFDFVLKASSLYQFARVNSNMEGIGLGYRSATIPCEAVTFPTCRDSPEQLHPIVLPAGGNWPRATHDAADRRKPFDATADKLFNKRCECDVVSFT